jgi:hypothetical protein
VFPDLNYLRSYPRAFNRLDRLCRENGFFILLRRVAPAPEWGHKNWDAAFP